MARSKGSANFSGSLEVLAGAPLDSRLVVPTKSDLTVASNYPYAYVGMVVAVQDESKLYILKAKPTTTAENWIELGSGSGGGSDNVVEGYYNAVDGKFYEESTHTTEITGAANVIYISLDTNAIYYYNGSAYINIYYPTPVYKPAGSVLFANLPVLSSAVIGNVYNVTDSFTTTVDFLEGAGHTYPANTNVVVIDNGTTLVPEYKFDVFTGVFEFDDIQKTVLPSPTSDVLGKVYQYTGPTTGTLTHGYFYECVEDSGSYVWEEVSVQEGDSGSGSLSKAITAAIDVGGIDAGDSFAVGTSYDDMWDALLNPTLYPTFTNPSASLSYSADTYYEVGATIPAKTATASLNRGSINPAYGTSGNRSGAATNYALASSGADTEYSDSSASSGTFSVPALTRASKGSITLTATISYAAGEQPKDSKGNNYDSPLAAGSKTATKTMNFIQAYYYGKSASSTVSNFTGLSKSVTAKGQKQFKFTTNNEHMVIAYDSSYGNLTSILDPNGFEVLSGWTKSTLTVDGFSYYVYVADSATTDTNAQFTFKY